MPLVPELRESPGDAVYLRMQGPVLVVLRVEVILVPLTLLQRGYSHIFSKGKLRNGAILQLATREAGLLSVSTGRVCSGSYRDPRIGVTPTC